MLKVRHDTTHPKLKSFLLSFLPPAPFPCGLIKARQALEEQRLGQKRLPRGLREHRDDDVAKWNESMEGAVRQMELEQSPVGENGPLKDAFGQSMHMEGDAGQTEVADASSWNKTLVDSMTQKPLGDGTAGQEAAVPAQDEAVERTVRTGKPRRGLVLKTEPTPGPAWQNKTMAPAAWQKERVENAAGQNQTGESAAQSKTGAVQTMRDGLNQSSDWGNISATPQFVRVNISSTLEHNDSRIMGGTLCRRGYCPWQVMFFFQSGHKYHT